MSLVEQIQKDIVNAMKSREEVRLSTLRMVKTALMNRKIEKMADLDEKEAQQVLSTLIKQRKDSEGYCQRDAVSRGSGGLHFVDGQDRAHEPQDRENG